MRLIDADKINFQWAPIAPVDINNMHCEPVALECEIDEQPTIDAVPVVHAHWIPIYPNQRTGNAYNYECSKCGRRVYNARQVSINGMNYDFCPHCGAKMDEEETAD